MLKSLEIYKILVFEYTVNRKLNYRTEPATVIFKTLPAGPTVINIFRSDFSFSFNFLKVPFIDIYEVTIWSDQITKITKIIESDLSDDNPTLFFNSTQHQLNFIQPQIEYHLQILGKSQTGQTDPVEFSLTTRELPPKFELESVRSTAITASWEDFNYDDFEYYEIKYENVNYKIFRDQEKMFTLSHLIAGSLIGGV